MEKDQLNNQYDFNKLAYLGDAYFELYIREKIINSHKNLDMNDIHKTIIGIVCAKNQSDLIQKLLDKDILNEKEIEIFKSARNLHSNSKSKNSPIRDYRKATGLEALIGYLYLNDKNRLSEILDNLEIM